LIRVLLIAITLILHSPTIVIAKPSPALLDRTEKDVLDCLAYTSSVNCTKASGSIENIKASSGPQGNDCNFQATKLMLLLMIFEDNEGIGAGSNGGANKYRAESLKQLNNMKKSCSIKK